jgi:uncharacterized membrane protein YfcA
MTRRKDSLFMLLGMLGIAAGIIVARYTHADYSDFAGGFLMGVSLVLMIFGLARQMKDQTK